MTIPISPEASAQTRRATIGCIVPAHNSAGSIEGLIRSLLDQTRVPDVIHVVVDNSSDATVEIATRFSGPREVVTELGLQFTEVFVHDLGATTDTRIGALSYGYELVAGYDYLLGVVGETTTDRRTVERLEIGALADAASGRTASPGDRATSGFIATWLLIGQQD